MRQLVAFLDAIDKRNTTKEYQRMKFQANLSGADMPSLESILGVGSEESEFDKDTDDFLEKRALKMLKEKQNVR